MCRASRKLIYTKKPKNVSSSPRTTLKKQLYRNKNLTLGTVALFAIFAYTTTDATVFDKIAAFFQSKPVVKSNSQTVALLDPLNSTENAGIPVLLEGDDSLSAETGPMGTQADIEDYYPASDEIQTYTTKDGDTLKGIAKMFDVSPSTIIWANNLDTNTKLTTGQTLVILPVSGLQYTPKKGDTVGGIAKRFGVDPEDITSFNGISTLTTGEAIIVPNGEMEKPTPVEKKPVKQIAKTTKEPVIIKKGETVFDRTIGSVFSLAGPQKGETVARSRRGEKIWGFNAPAFKDYYIFPVEGGIKTQDLHGFNGIDIGYPGRAGGAPIKAAAAGTVIVAKDTGSNGGYGKYVVIAHNNGTQTLYAHNSKNAVSVGDTVKQGEVIAYMGRTGKATGYHVHFEIRGAKNPFATSFNSDNTSND
ncbi:MAG: peptidoglycan DD-metalloendopeptidase family protein [bacterium]